VGSLQLNRRQSVQAVEVHEAARSARGGIKSAFTELSSRLTHGAGVFCAATLNLMEGVPAGVHTQLVVHRMPELAPLSGKAAAKMMELGTGKWHGEEVLGQAQIFSGGVPRLLEYAFQARCQQKQLR